MSTVVNLETGFTNAFCIRGGTIVFSSSTHQATARRVHNPGSFGAALARQALAQGLDALRRRHPRARLARDVRELCTFPPTFDVRVRLEEVR